MEDLLACHVTATHWFDSACHLPLLSFPVSILYLLSNKCKYLKDYLQKILVIRLR